MKFFKSKGSLVINANTLIEDTRLQRLVKLRKVWKKSRNVKESIDTSTKHDDDTVKHMRVTAATLTAEDFKVERMPAYIEQNTNIEREKRLIYGRYKTDLGSFAKFQAKQIKKQDKKDFGKIKKRERNRLWEFIDLIFRVRDWIFKKVGEEWIFLALLGIIMAMMSFAMDFVIEKMQAAKMYLYHEVSFSVPLQYVSWVMYSLLLICFATGFTHLMSPQAIGSGIPEMKTILRGVVLKEFLTFRTLVSKVVGLCSSLGSTMPFGKEGPFVHIASICANLIGKLSSFKGIYENESRRTEMLAAACAVGVSSTYAAPIGGVLFSIEVTATYFAVRNYWRGFFSAVCSAVMFRLLAFWFKYAETLTALFKTNLKTDFPFDPLELLAFSFLGVACGLLGTLFIVCHRRIVFFTRKNKKLSSILQKNRFIYPGFVVLLISSCTFPPGLGQFFAGQLTNRKAIDELFSNITWYKGTAEDLAGEELISHWNHPLTNIYVSLVLFIIMNFWMAAICNTLPIPAGVFVPVFTIGAAFGRLVGEVMAAWFPNGIKSDDVIHKIVPGGYAVVGAASLSGAVTRTISTSVIVFELTGQISYVLPAVIAVLISNAVANLFQPSFYDSIIQIKRLPYLPSYISSKVNSWSIYVEDIMVKTVEYVSFMSTYKDLKQLLEDTKYRTYPLVDSPDSMILLGSIKRFELERMLWVHLSQDQKIFLPSDDEDSMLSATCTPTASRADTPPPEIEIIPDKPLPRFTISTIEEVGQAFKTDFGNKPIVAVNRNKPGLFLGERACLSSSMDDIIKHDDEIHPISTLNLPLRSILKKGPDGRIITKSASLSDIQAGIDNHFRKLSNQRIDSIVEDVPFIMDKSNIKAMSRRVKLPPEAVKVKTLTADRQEAWEHDQLVMTIDWEGCQIDPAPFQLVERTSLHKVHSLFSLLGLNHAYVTNTGRLVGVIALKELRHAIQGGIDQAAEKKKLSKQHDECTDSEDDIDDPAHLEVEHPQDPDEYRLVNRFSEKLEDSNDEEEDDEEEETEEDNKGEESCEV